MKKKQKKIIHRLNKMLVLMLGTVEGKKPHDVCAVCCAIIAIMYNRMDDEGREIMAPTVAECLSVIVEDQKKVQADERVH